MTDELTGEKDRKDRERADSQQNEARKYLEGNHESLDKLGESIPDNTVSYTDKHGKVKEGIGIGPFIVRATDDGWHIIHPESGIYIAKSDSKEHAKAAAAIMGSQGNWQFKKRKEIDDETMDRTRKVYAAIRDNDQDALMKMAKESTQAAPPTKE